MKHYTEKEKKVIHKIWFDYLKNDFYKAFPDISNDLRPCAVLAYNDETYQEWETSLKKHGYIKW